MPTVVESYAVRAINVAHASENKIHDDTVARRLGFSGGLVPGVEYTPMLPMRPSPVGGVPGSSAGQWTLCSRSQCTRATWQASPPWRTRTAHCASPCRAKVIYLRTATARLPATTEAAPNFPAVTPPEERPPAAADTMPAGLLMGSRPYVVTPELAAQYLRDIGEREPLYAEAGLVHPGTVLRVCNWALAHSVRMGAWIHAGSKVRNLQTAPVGAELTGRARVLETYERKGHRFVDLDVVVMANGVRPVARVVHTAIYLPRQLADAAA